MKRSEVIKSISQDLEDIRIENYYDEKGSEWCANLILTKLEEINAVNRLERNGEIEVIPENEMVEFWQGFVEGQSKALQYSRKRIRKLVAENSRLREVVEFYAEMSNWTIDYHSFEDESGDVANGEFAQTCRNDCDDSNYGGKRARQVLKEFDNENN